MSQPDIKLYELAPTRSARCRWILLEAGLEYESVGNSVDILFSDELKALHPLAKLPVAIINGRPLFESSAIATAIADLVPEKNLVAKPGTWARTLHDQWVSFLLTEMEAHVQSTEMNTIEFVLKKHEHVPAIIEQNNRFYKKGASALEAHLADHDYLVEDRFTVTDIIAAYTLHFGEEQDLLGDLPNCCAYLERLKAREHCTLVPIEA